MTGDNSLDELLRAERDVPYVQYRLGPADAGRAVLVEALEQLASVVRINFPAYTQEVSYTDRVMRYPLYFPLNAVRWRTVPRDFAALVTEARTDRFAAEVYHFGEAPRKLDAELLLLKPGAYRFTLAERAAGKSLQSGMLTVARTNRALTLTLPSAVTCSLRVEPQ
jgi:hypothetical protein